MSATSVRFTVAEHLIAVLAFHPAKEIHPAVLAESVNTDASFVRKSLCKLFRAGLVSTSRGKKGSKLARSAKNITVLDIYRASSAPAAFAVHRYPEKKICPISVRDQELYEQHSGSGTRKL
jgi:DNA-binding IscR family transcriptional regulator